jgi:ComF family protein
MKIRKNDIFLYGRKMLFQMLEILYPRRCAVCDEIEVTGKGICPLCKDKVHVAGEPACKKCGKPLVDERKEFCTDCGKKHHVYTQGKAVFVYEGGIRNSMYRFKYGNKREYAEFYADAAIEKYGTWLKRTEAEVLIPVPMFPRKKRLRGYNQAEVFAQALGRKTGIPVERHLIKRVRNTTPQKELNDLQRRSNLKNAFQLTSDIVKYKKVVLVDDIYTTGSTMDEISKTLKESGVKKIYYICISIGEGY